MTSSVSQRLSVTRNNSVRVLCIFDNGIHVCLDLYMQCSILSGAGRMSSSRGGGETLDEKNEEAQEESWGGIKVCSRKEEIGKDAKQKDVRSGIINYGFDRNVSPKRKYPVKCCQLEPWVLDGFNGFRKYTFKKYSYMASKILGTDL